MVRVAFTLIELIFAIVIIGISVISLPLLNNTIDRTMEANLVQEAIFSASTELMGVTAGYWDENSMQDINKSSFSRVIDIAKDCNETTKLRFGHIAQPYHRRCLDNLATQPFNQKGGVVFDINDATHDWDDIFVNDTTDASGYKQTYQSKVTSDLDGNVKKITITVRDEKGDIITVLHSQSANIGEIDYYKRTL